LEKDMERESGNLDFWDYLRYKMRQDFDNASLYDTRELIQRFENWGIPQLQDEIKTMKKDLDIEEGYYRARNLERV